MNAGSEPRHRGSRRVIEFLAASLAWILVTSAVHANVDRDLEAAQQALARGDAAAALDALGEVGDATPQSEADPDERKRHAAGETLRGRALALLERWSDARSAYQRALTWNPDERAAAEGLFQVLVEQEAWDALLSVIGRWALREDSRPEILHLMIEAAVRTGDDLLALQMAERGVARFPNDRSFRIRRAHALTDVGSLAFAESAWASLAQRDPDDSRWWQALARIRSQRGDLRGAREAMAIAHAVDPTNDDITRSHLASLIDAGHAPDALRLARTWVGDSKRPSSDIAIAVRAAWISEEFELAANWLERVEAEDRDAEWLRWSLEIALVREDLGAARTAANSLIARGEASARVRLRAARLEEHFGDLVRAEAHLRAALDGSDSNASHLARLHLARLLLVVDRVDDAETFARAALDERPTDVTAQRLIQAVRRALLSKSRQSQDP